MKKILPLLAALLAAMSLLFMNPAAYGHQSERAKVSVTGSAVQQVKPDVVVWNIGLRSEGNDSARLAEAHAKRLSDLLEYLEKQDLDKADIRTEHMRLSENWNYKNGKRFKQGYVASSNLSFRSDIESYTAFWKGLAAFEGLSINGNHFEIADRIEIEKQVRKQALLAAREKASAMAKVLGVQIGKPIYIEDLHWGDDVAVSRMRMAKESFSAEPDIISPGELQVRMRVKVDFEIK